ncbi:MAG: DUF4340 domain-containing protein [Candidatus Eremiobacterota bacterium]
MNRSTLIMLVLVLGLGSFYYFHDIRGAKLREEAEKQEKRLFPTLKKDDLVGMEITHQDTAKPALVLEKRDGRWIRKGPPDEMVSVSEVGSVANSLVEVQRTEVVQESPAPKQLGPFGLEKPVHQIVLKAGAQNHTLQVGSKTHDSASYYVRVAPDGPVVTIPATISAVLERSPTELREKGILPVEPGKATRVQLTRAGQTLEMALELDPDAKKEEEEEEEDPMFRMETSLEGTWKILKPFAAGADSARVSSYLWEWKGLTAGRFLQPDEKPDFSKPELRLEVWVEGRKTPQILEVGGPVAVQPTMRYVRRLDPEEVMVADFTKGEILTRDAEFFRDRHLLVFQVDEVEKVEGTLGTTELAAKRSGGDWKIEKPAQAVDDKAVRTSAVSNLLWEMVEDQWKSEAPADAKTGVDKPRAKVTLCKAKGEKIGTLLVGVPTPDGKGCYVQVEGSKTVFVTEGDLYKRWEDAIRPMLAPPATPAPKTPGTPTATPTPR